MVRPVVLKLLKKIALRSPYNFLDHSRSHVNLEIYSGSAGILNDLTMSLLLPGWLGAISSICIVELFQEKKANVAVKT